MSPIAPIPPLTLKQHVLLPNTRVHSFVEAQNFHYQLKNEDEELLNLFVHRPQISCSYGFRILEIMAENPAKLFKTHQFIGKVGTMDDYTGSHSALSRLKAMETNGLIHRIPSNSLLETRWQITLKGEKFCQETLQQLNQELHEVLSEAFMDDCIAAVHGRNGWAFLEKLSETPLRLQPSELQNRDDKTLLINYEQLGLTQSTLQLRFNRWKPYRIIEITLTPRGQQWLNEHAENKISKKAAKKTRKPSDTSTGSDTE